MFYGEIFKILNKAHVKYVVVGGIAVVLHGYMRFTHDLDLVVALEPENLEKFFEALKKINYHPKAPITKEQFQDKQQRKLWQKEKGALVDIFVQEPMPFDKIYKKRVDVKINGTTVPLMCIDHLKKLKKTAGRPQDLIDIVQLTAIERIKK